MAPQIDSTACEKDFREVALREAVIHATMLPTPAEADAIVQAAQKFYAFLKDPDPRVDPKAAMGAVLGRASGEAR